MKKLLTAVLCILIVTSFAACGGHWGGGDYDHSKGDLFTFSTETIDGEAFTSDDIKDAKLVMINLWEPWCNPCVKEMPDLESIYQELKDEGFLILGVYSSTEMEEEARTVIEETGVTYPIIKMTPEFATFQTAYVPTTVFITGEGEVLLEDPIIGSNTHDTWASAVKGLLKGLKDD